MNKFRLIDAHREVNKLLTKLALGMGKNELNDSVVSLSERWFGRRKASILRLEAAAGRLYLECAPSLPDFYNQAIEGIEIGPTVGSCGAAASLKQTTVVTDINTHPNWAAFKDLALKARVQACWSVPILSSAQKVLGTFAIYSEAPSVPDEDELEVLQMLASLYAVAWEKYQLEEQLHYQARHDSLTDCYNRSELFSRSREIIDAPYLYTICIFADVNHFKHVNDHYGHDIGDNVLRAVGEVFNQAFAENGLSVRYGGDEFVAFSFANTQQALEDLVQSVITGLSNNHELNHTNVTVSVGKTICLTGEFTRIEPLIQLADKDMYRVKYQSRT